MALDFENLSREELIALLSSQEERIEKLETAKHEADRRNDVLMNNSPGAARFELTRCGAEQAKLYPYYKGKFHELLNNGTTLPGQRAHSSMMDVLNSGQPFIDNATEEGKNIVSVPIMSVDENDNRTLVGIAMGEGVENIDEFVAKASEPYMQTVVGRNLTAAIQDLTAQDLKEQTNYFQKQADVAMERAEAERKERLMDKDLNTLSKDGLKEWLATEGLDAVRSGRPIAMAMCDLDRLKWANDTIGHPAGDALLRNAADKIQKHLPKGAILARTGGDEFVAVYAGTKTRDDKYAGPSADDPGVELYKACDAAREAIYSDGKETVKAPLNEGGFKMIDASISIGVAEQRLDRRGLTSENIYDALEPTLMLADAKLSEAKRGARDEAAVEAGIDARYVNGRNQVVVTDEIKARYMAMQVVQQARDKQADRAIPMETETPTAPSVNKAEPVSRPTYISSNMDAKRAELNARFANVKSDRQVESDINSQRDASDDEFGV